MKTNTITNPIKVLMVLGALMLQLPLLFAQNTPVAKNGQLRVIGTKLCNQYGNPIQLRGMSTHGIQWYGWGGCLNESSLTALSNDWGADVLRISLYVQEGGYETNPTAFTNQVTTLINEATERGMYALVDWHQLTPGDPNANLANAKKFFTDIANLHKNKNNIIYDVCNEPNGVSWDRIKIYADQIIPVIRAIDGDAVVLVGTHGWGSMGVSDGRSPQDIVNNPVNATNIMYTFHFYAKDHRDNYLNQLDWASDRLPVFVTEFGTQEASGDGPNDFTMAQKYIDLMARKKISWTNWNFSDDFRSGAVWTTGTCGSGPYTTARLKPAGAWIRDRMLSPADDFPGGTTNTFPTITLTSPVNNSAYFTGNTVTLSANASDANGSVTKVEFFINGNKVGEDVSSPYSINWTATTGTHSVTARATDNEGASTTTQANSIVVSVPVSQTPYSGTPYSIPGKIEAENYDNGGQGVAFNDLEAGNSGSAYRTENVDIEATTDAGGGFNVGWILQGEWLEYTVNVTTAGTYKLDVRVAATAAGKNFHIELDGQNISGTISVPNTGNWQTWQTVTVTTTALSAGQKVLRVVMDSGDFNINHFTFSANVPNVVPVVNITSPTNNTPFNSGTAIAINANATDTDGSITKVEFYAGGTKIGEDLTSPYSLSWTTAPVGTHSLTAKATDNAGASVTSAAVIISVVSVPNNVPVVNVTSPTNNTPFNSGTAININANATDSDGTITKVEFYAGGTKIGEDLTSPYSIAWTTAPVGTHSLTAKAMDNLGASVSSAAVIISVVALPNNSPSVNITSPASNASFDAGTTVVINANASDSDGSIAKVEFYSGSTKLGEDATSPYSFSWSGAAVGSYSLTAKATDDKGASTTSSSVSITVKQPTNNCSGLPGYVENGGYVAGSKVQNAGGIYECKPYPFTGWCNGVAWAYAPGTGAHWSDAWVKTGSCTGSAAKKAVTNSPNPFNEETSITIDVENAGESTLIVYDNMGREVAVLNNGYLTSGTHSFSFIGSHLKPGFYICKYINGSHSESIIINKQF